MQKIMPKADPHRRILSVILLAFLLLALTYTVSVPLGEAPDEVPHFSFVRFLAEKRALPEDTEAGSEGFQPPLYYLLGALATSWIDMDDFEIRANTDFSWDRPETSRNLLVHGRAEGFPYKGGALAWHLVRLLSIAMGTITIVATYLIGRRIFPDRPIIALGMATVIAFTPEFIFMSSVVNNDNLIAMLSALLMLKLIGILKGATSWRDFIQLGSLLGLALLTKSSAIVYVPLSLMVIFSAPVGKKPNLLQSALWTTVTAIFAFGFSGWWFLRNQLLFGDPLGWSLKVSMSDVREGPLGWQDLIWLADGLFQSFWGRFGGAAHLRLSQTLYIGLSILVLASLAGCAVAAIKLLRNRHWTGSPAALPITLAALAIALIAISLVRWTMTFLGTDQARLLYPVLPSIILFFVLGLLQLVPARLHRFSVAGLGLALFTVAAITPFSFINSVYRPPDLLLPSDRPLTPNPVSLDFSGTARLVGFEFDRDLYEPGQTAKLTLFWQALGHITEGQWLRVQVIDRSGKIVFQKEGCPSGGSYSADLWQPGEIVPAAHYLRLDPALPTDTYSLRLAMRPASSKAWVTVFDRTTGKVSDNTNLGKLRLGSTRNAAGESPEQNLRVTVGGKFRLAGFTLKGVDGIKPGERFRLILYWQKLPGVEVDTKYTAFTQLLDANSAIQAQADSQPLAGAYPTTVWSDSETIADSYDLVLNQQAKPGDYSLIAGLYDANTGQRLAMTDEAGSPLGDFARLVKLTIR